MPVLLRVANGATYSALVKASCTFKMLGCECWNHSWKMGGGGGVEGQFLGFCFSVDFFFFIRWLLTSGRSQRLVQTLSPA